jgi:alkylation response protein AidB-like acyl-CoA dehydrogenase
MDLDFTPQEQAFRDEVRAFLADKLTPRLRDGAAMSPGVFVEPDIGQDWNAALHAKGWLTYQWPEASGGPGWSAVQRYIFEKECALAGAPTLTVLGLKLVGPVIYTFGTDDQKAHYLPRILSGEDYWCQGFSEPGSGSDLASLQCRAERRGDKYIINGSKIWTTHAHHANRIFCLVRTDPDAKRQAGISFLLINMRQPGVTIRWRGIMKSTRCFSTMPKPPSLILSVPRAKAGPSQNSCWKMNGAVLASRRACLPRSTV